MNPQDALKSLENAALPSPLESLEQATGTAPTSKPAVPLSAVSKAAQGLGDPFAGTGQLVEHVPGLKTITNGWRMILRAGLSEAGLKGDRGIGILNADFYDPQTTAQFDERINQRETEYDEARKAAHETGIDWWRLAGNIANPINYLGGGAAKGATLLARMGRAAATGGALAMLQPTVVHHNDSSSLITNTAESPDNYWWEKTKSALVGSLSAGAISGSIEAAVPFLKVGIKALRKALGSNSKAASGAAEAIVTDAMRAQGVKPEDVDINAYSAMKQEVQEAISSGAKPDDISQAAVINRMKAQSLPVPINLTRGQASGNPMLFASEQNLKGVQNAGEALAQRFEEQNQGFIANLDALGAKDAPDSVSASHMINETLSGEWNRLDTAKTELYDAVRNSKGLSAKLNAVQIGKQIRTVLGSPEAFHAWADLPESVQMTIRDLEDKNLPLTVSILNKLDQTWGGMMAGADGNTRHALGMAREILGNAPIDDDVGAEARQAYQMAKQAHAQQMSLIDRHLLNKRPNPAYQPLMEAVVNGKSPDSLFGSGFMNAAPSTAKANLDYLVSIDPEFDQTIGKTFMGEIKRQVVNDASEGRNPISEAKLRSFARDPVKSARMQAIMPDPAVRVFKTLADVVETAKKPPVSSVINYSGTAPTMMNMAAAAAKSNIGLQLLSRVPGIRGGLVQPVVEATRAAKQAKTLQDALQPGVTLKSLFSTTEREARNRALVTRAAIPAAIAAHKKRKSSEQGGN